MALILPLTAYSQVLSHVRCSPAVLKAAPKGVRAVLAKRGLHPPVNDLWGLRVTAYLNELELADGYHIKVESLRDLVELYDREVAVPVALRRTAFS